MAPPASRQILNIQWNLAGRSGSSFHWNLELAQELGGGKVRVNKQLEEFVIGETNWGCSRTWAYFRRSVMLSDGERYFILLIRDWAKWCLSGPCELLGSGWALCRLVAVGFVWLQKGSCLRHRLPCQKHLKQVPVSQLNSSVALIFLPQFSYLQILRLQRHFLSGGRCGSLHVHKALWTSARLFLHQNWALCDASWWISTLYLIPNVCISAA